MYFVISKTTLVTTLTDIKLYVEDWNQMFTVHVQIKAHENINKFKAALNIIIAYL